MARAEIEVGLRFEGAVVRPGDTLVLLVHPPSYMTGEERDRMEKLTEARLPGVTVCVVEGVGQALVYRGDEDRHLVPAQARP